jgi:hypothetical protein
METEKRGAWWIRALEDHPEAAEATPEQVEAVFTAERTIAEDVWRGREYVPYAAGDWDAVLRAEPLYGQLDGRHQAYMQRLVAQRPGLVMQRNGFPGAPGALAQLRPFKFKELGVDVLAEYGVRDEGVYSKTRKHSHHRIVVHTHGDRKQARAADIDEVLGREAALLAYSRDDVLDLADLYALPLSWVSTTGPEEWKFADSPIEDHLQREHGNVPTDDEHSHWPNFGAHVARTHDGKDVRGIHSHHEFAKYLLPPGEGTGARVDVHPLVWPLLERGGPVCYFALEGLLKSDAILSVGFTGPGTGTPVVNVPSVTLWAGEPGLDWLARTYLTRFDLVVIVPDSDGLGIPNGNYDVNSQARGLADRLRRCDVPEVVVAFPTARCGRVCTHIDRDIGEGWKLPNEDHKQGIDDMLGPKGKNNTGGLAGMVIMQTDQATPAAIMQERSDIRSRERDLAVLEHVREIADPVTCVAAFSDRQIAPAVDRGKSQVAEAVKSLERRGYWEGLDSEPVTGSRVMTRVRLRRDLVPEVQGYGRLGDAYALD